MRTGVRWSLFIVVLLIGSLRGAPDSFGAADREKLLNEPGIFGTFAVFALDDAWMKQNQATRISQLTLLRGVIEQHREKIAIDVYLMRGLSEKADLMFRVHAAELRDTQQFLLDLQSSAFGKYLKTAGLMHGLTKKPNYVPGLPDQLKADLKGASEAGPSPYAIVVPIQKSADWWALDREKRAAMMREHTEASAPYIPTVKRKLYHSSGLDDLDFITYFETSRLEDFHSLVLALEQVEEFHYVRRFGHPTLIGAVKSVDEVIEALAQ
jgi:chlorite dismutase